MQKHPRSFESFVMFSVISSTCYCKQFFVKICKYPNMFIPLTARRLHRTGIHMNFSSAPADPILDVLATFAKNYQNTVLVGQMFYIFVFLNAQK
jgi:hypothetical protein